MRQRAHAWIRTQAAAALAAAALVCVGAASAEMEPAPLSGEGPVLPRASEPRSARTLVPAADEVAPETERAQVLEAAGTEDEREGATPNNETSTLRAFLDEMLDLGLWDRLPASMGVEARRSFLEDRAIRTYREGIVRFPESPFVPEAHLHIAAIFARRGDTRAALAEYALLLERFPNHESADDARLARAELMFDMGDFAAARDESYLLIDGYLDSPLAADAYLLAARAHEQLGELEAARTAYAHVLERTAAGDERLVQAREGLAGLDLAQGRGEAAVATYRQLLDEAPTQAQHDARQFALAKVYLGAGEPVRARRVLRQILGGYKLNASREAAAYLLADSYYAEGRMAQAAQYYARALLDFPTFEQRTAALFRAADAYKTLTLYEEALAMVRQVATARDPAPTPAELARAKLVAGELLYLNGQYSAALEALYGAIVGELTVAERQQAAYRIAQSYYRGGYYNEALEAFDAALKQAPEHELAFEATLAVADCTAKRGWLDEARRQYRAILDATSELDTPEQLAERSKIAFTLLDTYGEQGRDEDELQCAKEMLERGFRFLDQAQLLYRMARAYERLNNPVQAEALYQQVRSQSAGSTWAEQAAVKIRQMDMLTQINALAH
jgi:TolA-binding protein